MIYAILGLVLLHVLLTVVEITGFRLEVGCPPGPTKVADGVEPGVTGRRDDSGLRISERRDSDSVSQHPARNVGAYQPSVVAMTAVQG